MDKDAFSKDEFEEKVEELFDDVLQLEHRPPHEGLDGALANQTAGIFKELAQMVSNLHPVPSDPYPASSSHTTTPQNTKLQTTSPLSYARDIVALASIALIVFSFFNFAFFRFRVSGPSMEPGISNENFLMVNQWAYTKNDLQHGDIVALYSPAHPDELYIKRVIAIPGDEVEIIGGWLYINDRLIDEPYLGTPDDFDYPMTIVPENTAFVLGDNRRISEDSRSWGPVPSEYIIGRASFVYWPLNDFGFVEHYHSSLLLP